MANMACNWVNCPDLVKKLEEAGALGPGLLHDRFGGEQQFDHVLDYAKCCPENLKNNPDIDRYPVYVDTPNQLHYYSRYTPFDEPQWRISRLLSEDVIRCMTMVEMEDCEPDMWEFMNGEEVSADSWELEDTTVLKVQIKEVKNDENNRNDH